MHMSDHFDTLLEHILMLLQYIWGGIADQETGGEVALLHCFRHCSFYSIVRSYAAETPVLGWQS